MNQKKSSVLLRIAKVFSVMLILCVFLVMFVYCVFLPRTTFSNYDTLTPFPEFSFSALADGSYTAQLGAYFSDTVFGKDQLKVYYSKLTSLFGKETVIINEDGEEEIIIGDFSIPTYEDESETSDKSESENSGNIFISDEPSEESASSGTTSSDASQNTSQEEPESSAPSIDTSSEEPEESDDKPAHDEELCDGIMIMGTRAMELYYGDTQNKLPRYASALKMFADKNPNINVYSMLIPKSCEYYIGSSKSYGHLAGNALKDTNKLKSELGNKVTTIDIHAALEAHKKEDIYFRTDHHWTALGAYYACEQFAKQLGLPFKDLSTYEKNVRPGYLGTMDRYTSQHPNIHNNPEDFVTYVPDASYKATFYDQSFQNGFNRDSMFFRVGDSAVSSWYLTFINGDAYSVKLESDECSNGRKLLIVKDSYGNALAPYLLYSFEEIYIVDARAFTINLNTFVKDHGITDVLFAECAYSAVGVSYISDVENLVK